ncbi:Rossmann-fold NAD(P)-binding domain-containing protein [Bacilliculturomica massiliensis]|uniref:hypothetical protein n=1 Tax=Bacilliculturomica massiliensis TaxID=1917867 RepID=UPI00103138E4|nr:hypothetical protein [Bacilliculturomica massiliensis]
MYVNFRYNGIYMQARYGNLTSIPDLQAGRQITRGDIIGMMGKDTEPESSGNGGVVALAIGRSTDGRLCSIDGSNVEFTDPYGYLERPVQEEDHTDYLTKPMATIRDTTGLDLQKTEENADY